MWLGCFRCCQVLLGQWAGAAAGWLLQGMMCRTGVSACIKCTAHHELYCSYCLQYVGDPLSDTDKKFLEIMFQVSRLCQYVASHTGLIGSFLQPVGSAVAAAVQRYRNCAAWSAPVEVPPAYHVFHHISLPHVFFSASDGVQNLDWKVFLGRCAYGCRVLTGMATASWTLLSSLTMWR